MRRTAITGIGVVAPGASSARRSGTRSPRDGPRRGRSRPSTPPDFARRSPPRSISIRSAAGLSEHERRRHGSLRAVRRRGRGRGRHRLRAGPRGARSRPHGRQSSAPRSAARWCWRTATWRSPTTARSGWSIRAYAPPFLYQGLIPSTLASEIALKFGAHGPSVVISTGCTSGIDAIGYGHQMIQDGEADIVISGAAESPGVADLDGVLRSDQGDLAAQRRRGPRLAAVRPRPRRLRDGRGLRGADPRGAGRRARPRRAHLLRGHRVRQRAATPTT